MRASGSGGSSIGTITIINKNGPIEHVTGPDTAPYLPPDIYHPDKVESIPIPAKAGDMNFFNYCTIHWSSVNRTKEWRRSIRLGYRHPAMRPVGKDPKEPYDGIIAASFKEHQKAK